LLVLEAGPSISVQVLNECTNVRLKKCLLPWYEIEEALVIIQSLVANVRAFDTELLRTARDIARRYKLGVYVSLIIAAARLEECDTLFSEDMQHGLIIDNCLTIINPFLSMEAS
jgi:predicted nucleic acid-binding protein